MSFMNSPMPLTASSPMNVTNAEAIRYGGRQSWSCNTYASRTSPVTCVVAMMMSELTFRSRDTCVLVFDAPNSVAISSATSTFYSGRNLRRLSWIVYP